jgi:hypothetical protein
MLKIMSVYKSKYMKLLINGVKGWNSLNTNYLEKKVLGII